MRPLPLLLMIVASGIGFLVVRILRSKGFEADTISLFTTLWGTAIGVVLAIWLTDLYTSYSQKDKLMTLYDVAERELQNCVHRVGANIVAVKKKETPFYHIELPTVLDRVVLEPEYQQFFSPVMKYSMFPQLTTRLRQPPVAGKGDDKLRDLVHLHLELEYRLFCIQIERDYLNGKTTPDEMEVQLDQHAESDDKVYSLMLDDPTWTPIRRKSWKKAEELPSEEETPG